MYSFGGRGPGTSRRSRPPGPGAGKQWTGKRRLQWSLRIERIQRFRQPSSNSEPPLVRAPASVPNPSKAALSPVNRPEPPSISLSTDAIQRGLKQNLGLILQTSAVKNANGQRLEMLQSLLPTVTGQASIEVEQINLAAYGLKFPGLNPIIGPFQVVDFRGVPHPEGRQHRRSAGLPFSPSTTSRVRSLPPKTPATWSP